MTPPHICDYLPFEEDLALYSNNLEFPLPKDDLNQVWLKFWRRFFFNNLAKFLHFFLLSPLWRGPGTLFEQFRIPFTQRWFLPSLIEIGLLVLEKKNFKNFQCIFTLLLLSPLGDGQSLHLNKLESPPPKNDLCQVCLKLAQ